VVDARLADGAVRALRERRAAGAGSRGRADQGAVLAADGSARAAGGRLFEQRVLEDVLGVQAGRGRHGGGLCSHLVSPNLLLSGSPLWRPRLSRCFGAARFTSIGLTPYFHRLPTPEIPNSR